MLFLERRTFDSLYRRSDGRLTLVPHGPTTRYSLTADVLDHFWSVWLDSGVNRWRTGAFVNFLRSKIVADEADDVDFVYFCEEDARPMLEDDMRTTGHGTTVCERCSEDYYACYHCDEIYRDTTTAEGEEVCEGCLESYNYCDDCGEYFHYDSDHSHECDCESEHPVFSIAGLDSDVMVDAALPAGVISDVGMGTIARHIREHARNVYAALDADPDVSPGEAAHVYTKWNALSYDFADAVGADWQGKRGNFPKRLSRHAHVTHGLTIPPALLSQIGNVGRDHSTGSTYRVSFTRNLNLPAEDFAHADSCWWQSYSEGRCALKTNGGMGLRAFDGYGQAVGRAWVMPLKRDDSGGLTPTFDNGKAVAWVVFNGYGTLSGYVAARIVAQHVGGTYRKINYSCSPMYVNSDSGYLVGAEDVVSPYTDGSLHLVVSQHSTLATREAREVLVSA